MRWYSKLAAALLAASLQACVTAPLGTPLPAEVREPVTILVSIDGFRADYLDRGITPNLAALAAAGVQAAMRPSFPTKTYPNHWALVTGLRPDRNGIVANRMEDPARPGQVFTMVVDDPFWWNAAPPIWIDAEKAGIRTGTQFWPGSNVAFGGTKDKPSDWKAHGGSRPSDWTQFNQSISNDQRVDGIIDWLRRPAATRPRFLTLYFDLVDSAGHDFGPDAAETNAAVAAVDAQIGRLRAGLQALGQPANLVVVADHGMAAIANDRVVPLDTMLDAADYKAIEDGPYASLNALPGREAALEARLLTRHEHMQCWRKTEIPARFHYGTNPRVPAYLCLADVGWTIRLRQPDPNWVAKGGNHGWDNRAPEMAALFVASGPGIAPRGKLAPFDNVDIHPLLRRLIGLPRAEGVDGKDATWDGVTR
jgi:predicted AlkP superfamily pyrophosphatase or phosphodiesterase